MANNQRSIIDFYRDFETTGIQGSRIISRNFSRDIKNRDATFEQIFKLFYPDSTALASAEVMLEKLIQLGTDPRSTSSGAQQAAESAGLLHPAREIAKLMRIYHTSLKENDSSTLSDKARDIYVKGLRPSAYKAYNEKTKAYELINNPLHAIGIASGTPLPADKKNPSLMYILVDTPNIDIKLRHADKVSVFLNYVPTIIASQLQPYLDVEFNLSRNIEKDKKEDVKLSSMSQLKFLMGPESIQPGSANEKIYKATSYENPGGATVESAVSPRELIEAQLRGQYAAWSAAKVRYEATQKVSVKIDGKYKQAPAAYPVPKPPNPDSDNKSELLAVEEYLKNYEKDKGSSAPTTVKQTLTAGIELFTMPQTLLNMDPNSNAGRFQPVINPTSPFGAITNLTIDIRPSVGVMSFKTATLTLKIFDRSRMVEIADFLNPKLYQAVTLWLTYGWRAPMFPPQSRPGLANDVKIYSDFINDSMLRREAYGVRNVSVNTETNGVTTITLSLFTRGGAELLEVKDSRSGDFDRLKEKIGAQLEDVKNLAKKMGLQSFAETGKELRGSQVISAALSGDIVAVDVKELNSITAALKKSLEEKGFGADAAKLETLLKQVYGKSGIDGKSLIDDQFESAARGLTRSRFSGLLNDISKNSDVWAMPNIFNAEASTADGKYSGDSDEVVKSNAFRNIVAARVAQKSHDASRDSTDKQSDQGFGGFGAISFGRLFANYFTDIARSLTGNSIIDDIQVVFYNLNSLAGPVANLNIAEFPIEIGPLEEAYAKKVAEQKGENMSFTTLLEVVKDSQFSRMQHSAYGFQAYFTPDKKTGKLVPDENKSKDLSSAVLKNYGLPGAFSLPALEFYIETSHSSGEENTPMDILESIDRSRQISSGPDKSSKKFTKIMRIHVYDKAAIPHQAATQILSAPNGYVEVDSEAYRALQASSRNSANNLDAINSTLERIRSKLSTLKVVGSDINQTLDPSKPDNEINIEAFRRIAEDLGLGEIAKDVDKLKKLFNVISFKNEDGSSASFEKVKRQIAKYVPTIIIGSNGSMIESSNYATGNDALLSTIMMLRNSKAAANPSQPNGSGVGDLPLRIVPGALTINSLGCPLVEYMQQFFVDLGTGTTADNLYNVTGLTHTFTPGKFSTQIKFTFADAYGRYESPQSFIDGVVGEFNKINDELEKMKKTEEEKIKKQGGKKPPSPSAPQ